LINASLKGLVKVGKTKRDTQERANELSGTTGVPTPFIVAYEIFVSDCTQAEEYLHTLLGTKGYRISQNREFFDIPLKELIPIMIEVQKKYPANIENDAKNKIEDFEETSNPGNDLYSEAMKYYYGDDNYLQDYSESIRLLKQAAKLGVIEAYYWLGKMYRSGKGCSENYNQALEYLKKGISSGYKRCYQEMAYLYLDNLRHFDNAFKCWTEFKKCKYYMSLNSDVKTILNDSFFGTNTEKNPTETKTDYFKNGNVKSIKKFYRGLLHGSAKIFFSTGKLKYEGVYDFGHKKGKCITYYTSGGKKYFEIWGNWKPLKTKKYHKSGRLIEYIDYSIIKETSIPIEKFRKRVAGRIYPRAKTVAERVEYLLSIVKCRDVEIKNETLLTEIVGGNYFSFNGTLKPLIKSELNININKSDSVGSLIEYMETRSKPIRERVKYLLSRVNSTGVEITNGTDLISIAGTGYGGYVNELVPIILSEFNIDHDSYYTDINYNDSVGSLIEYIEKKS